MAAATINVNLTTLDDADDDDSRWEPVGRSGQVTGDPDIYVQKSDASTSTFSQVTTLGVEIELLSLDTGAPITFGEHEHLYAWLNFTAPAKLESTANGGQRIAFGDGTSGGGTTLNNYAQYFVGGNEAEFLSGGWRCYCASPTVTPQSGVVETTPQSFAAGGRGAETTTKDNMFVDVIRYGRGLQLVDGDGTNPGAMKSFTDENDLIINQYGVVRAQGTGASVQGEVSIGHTDATSTSTFFDDSNYSIFVPNKNPLSSSSEFVTLSTFTGFRILGSGTTASFSNFSFSTADEHDKGYFSCQPSYPFTYSSGVVPKLITLDGCIFQDWGQTQFGGITTATNSTWINCEAITLNGGILEQSTVETGIGGTYLFAAGDADHISNVSFIGNGDSGGHAIEVTQSGSYTFDGNTFENFGGNLTDGAAIHIKGDAVDATFNITGNEATAEPTYKLTGVGATVAFIASVNVNVTGLPVTPEPEDATEIRVLIAGQDLFSTAVGIGTTDPAAGIGTESNRTDTFSFSIKKDASFDLRIINLDYEPQFISSTTAANDPTVVPANLKLDRVSQNDNQ